MSAGVCLLVGRVVLGTGEVVRDEHAGPFTSFRLVGGGNGDLGVRLGGKVGDGREDGISAVGLDEVDQGLQVASGRVVGGVVLQIGPRKERG